LGKTPDPLIVLEVVDVEEIGVEEGDADVLLIWKFRGGNPANKEAGNGDGEA
jgi:hypothetical protein